MLNSLLFYIKKYWYLYLIFSFISIPLLYASTTKTNYSLTLNGDTVEFDRLVDVDTDYKQYGSFETIYVTTLDHSTKFLNFVSKFDKSIDKNKMTKAEIGYTPKDSNRIGKIQYASSINNALILSYNEAKKDNSNINIDYSYLGYFITYKNPNCNLEIGDHLYGCKLINENKEYFITDSDYKKAISKCRSGDIFYIQKYDSIDNYRIKSKSEIIEYVLQDCDFHYDNENLYRDFSYTESYDVNHETLIPSVSFGTTSVNGPSGGTLQALSIYNQLTEFDYTYGIKIAGTGTININGMVGAIGGIKQKINTAIDNNIKIFFCPKANYSDALKTYNKNINRKRMKLIEVETFYDCINYLKEYKNV